VDDKIMKLINDAVQTSDTAGFEAVRRRIEAQTEQEQNESRQQTVAMLEESASGTQFPLKRILAMAASVVLVFGIGVGLIAASVGSVSFDSASTESTIEDSMVQTEESMESASESQEQPQENFGYTTDGENTGMAEEAVSGSDNKESALTREYTVHTISQLGLTIALPSEAYVSGRDVSEDFELLSIFQMSEGQLEANYKDRNIYYNAVWYDNFADVTEIVVKMTADDLSDRIFNLRYATQEQLDEIENLYMNYEVNVNAVVGARYYDVSIIEHEQALFFRACGTVKNRSGRSNHLQYMTIVNGCRIEITLIEHFGINDELTGEEPEMIAEEHSQLMQEVIKSAKWERIRSNFLRQNRGAVFYGLIILAGMAAVIAVVLMPENRDKLKGMQSHGTMATETQNDGRDSTEAISDSEEVEDEEVPVQADSCEDEPKEQTDKIAETE